jgi:hypothetical protein
MTTTSRICTMHKERTGWQGAPAIGLVVRNAYFASPEFSDFLESLGITCDIDISNRQSRIFTVQADLDAAKAALAPYFGEMDAKGIATYNGKFGVTK